VLCLTTAVAMFVSVKLFRWEKEEKIKTSAKLWLVAVLAPFIAMGGWQAYSQQNVVKTKILARELNRSRSFLIKNVRIFTGNDIVENGAVLIREGKIVQVFTGSWPDAKAVSAESIDAVGKTILPGLIDVDVHLSKTGGIPTVTPSEKDILRELAAYLYSGVTAVASEGDPPYVFGKVQETVASGERLGALVFRGRPSEGAHISELSVAEAVCGARLEGLLDRPLVQQAVPAKLLDSVRHRSVAPAICPDRRQGLLQAWNRGETLVAGSGAGTMFVLHGPTVQYELQLWVEAGIPNVVALRGATVNAAKLLHVDNRMGSIRPGMDATLLVVEGNPLADIKALSIITSVFFKGERVGRSSIFDQD